MKLNNEYRFGMVPKVMTPRSTFIMHQNIRTTFNAGKLIPFYVDSDIMPGDTFKMKGTFIIRMSTPIYPTMDNLFADIRFFFVPHRIVWNNFKQFMGENETGSWTQQTEFTIPQIIVGKSGTQSANSKVTKGSPLNYMGIPIGWPRAIPAGGTTEGASINALPYRAYQAIWSDWYRDENFAAPQNIYKQDGTMSLPQTYSQWGQYVTDNRYVNTECAPVYKLKDMFNSCLPEPQKGAPVTLPIGQSAPIISEGNALKLNDGTNDIYLSYNNTNTYPSVPTSSAPNPVPIGESTTLPNFGQTAPATNKAWGIKEGQIEGYYADLSNAVAATINAQRLAFATQRILEASARSGTRYAEIIANIFNVKGSLSAVLQRPEYLGGIRKPINMTQVVQTSSTDSTSPQGNTAAMSLTVDSTHYFTKSFTEHGTLLGVLCVRQEHSYDQGIARMWSRKRRYDFYWPQLAFIGEQAILNKEIYADGSDNDNGTFGFNERWIELKAKTNINTGAFSTQYAQSLDAWHYGDSYSQLPVLSDAWRRETKDYIDRTLAVTSAVEDQFIMDSRWDMEATRPVPMYSIPGLLDHF